MNYIRGITFAPFVRRGVLDKEEARESLKAMRERTGADTVLLAPGGLQKTAHSTDIGYDSEYTMGACQSRKNGIKKHSMLWENAHGSAVRCSGHGIRSLSQKKRQSGTDIMRYMANLQKQL